MKYTVEDLIKENKDWKKDDFIFFWKIRKGKEINKSCLSQWYPFKRTLPNDDVENPNKPLSHASLIKKFIEENQ